MDGKSECVKSGGNGKRNKLVVLVKQSILKYLREDKKENSCHSVVNIEVTE